MSTSTPTSFKTVCPYCGVGCGMIVQVENNRVTKVGGDKANRANFGKLCTKGLTVAETLDPEHRLTQAFLRPQRSEPLKTLPLADAIRETAQRLNRIIQEHGRDAVAFYVSGQLSMESQYLINKLSKGFIRTNNIDSNSRLCMSSAASGYRLSFGADGPPGSYEDFERADCFLVIGSNMAECHPILYLRLQERRRQSGAKLIVVDPRRTPTAEKADLYLAIEPGTDLAFLNGLLHLLVVEGKIDSTFIESYTDGWSNMPGFLADYTPSYVAEITGLAEDDLRTAARWIGESPEVMSLWTMGLNQSTHGTWQTNAICNLHLATGKICRPGSGPFSLTGQPNAMGGREMGYLSQGLPGQRLVTSKDDRSFIEDLWQLPSGAIGEKPGADAVDLFRKLKSGEIKAVWIMGTNPVASLPNRQNVIDGLNQAQLVIVQDAYATTETTGYADILLPGALWLEAEGIMVNSERQLTLMAQALTPQGETEADWRIIARVAQAMGFEKSFTYASAAEVFDEIRQTTNFQTGYDLRGISHARLRETPLQWPCALIDQPGQAIRYRTAAETSAPFQLRFATVNGRAQFFARPYLPPAESPDAAYPMILTTGRLAHQWHTLTKTGKVAALNRLNPGPLLELNPEDAVALDLQQGDLVEIVSRRGRAVLPAHVTEAIRPGCCFAPFHWNDCYGDDLAINAATSEAIDAISKQPELKYCAVRLSRVTVPITSLKPDFHLNQQSYLRFFFDGVRRKGYQVSGAEPLPESAPFSPSQRAWLGSLLNENLSGS